MKEEEKRLLSELCERYPVLAPVIPDIERAYLELCKCFTRGGRLYLCGNGGSASDCEHVAGELLKSFRRARPVDRDYAEKLRKFGREGELLAKELQWAVPAISLCGHPAFSTAFANDSDPELVFAQGVNALGNAGDALMVLSTSGNSRNCVYAAIAASAKGMKVIFLGGGDGGKLKGYSDVSVIVPEKETYRVQELHLPVYHCLCALLEFFAGSSHGA